MRCAVCIVKAIIKWRAVEAHAMVHEVHPGVQTGSTWRARRSLAVVPGECGCVTRERIKVRCAHHGVTKQRQTVAPKLVERDQQDVWLHELLRAESSAIHILGVEHRVAPCSGLGLDNHAMQCSVGEGEWNMFFMNHRVTT